MPSDAPFAAPRQAPKRNGMNGARIGQVAVIFMAARLADDQGGYGAAATAMEALAATQPGYCGFESARGADGFGIAVSFWADAGSAKAWRDHPDHKSIRDAGRSRWYAYYEVAVADVTRSYAWQRP